MATQEFTLRLSDNGRIVIPATVRKTLGVGAGDEIILRQEGDNDFRITTQRLRIAEARKRIRTYIKQRSAVVDEFLAERREAAKHE
jgi:AbrB family looped-hinge helix DNA binding protein